MSRWINCIHFAGVAPTSQSLQLIIDAAAAHSQRWRYLTNVKKSAVLLFNAPAHPVADSNVVFRLGSSVLPRVQSYKYLGIMFHEDVSWSHHIKHAKRGGQKAVFSWFKALASKGLSFECKQRIINTFILPTLTYGAEVWDGSKAERSSLDSVLRVALRVAMGLSSRAPTEMLHWELGVPLVSTRLDAAKLRWDEKLKGMSSSRLPLALRDYAQGANTRPGRPAAGTNWCKGVAQLRNSLSIIGIVDPFSRSTGPPEVSQQPEVGTTSPPPPCPNNAALNLNLWERDRRLFIRGRESKWLHSSRPLWYPLCMSREKPALQQHLRVLPAEDAKVFSLARLGLVSVGNYLYNKDQAFSAFDPLAGLSCPKCGIHLNSSKVGAIHLLGSGCAELIAPRTIFLREIEEVVDPLLLTFFKKVSNIGLPWARALFCPDDACDSLGASKIKKGSKLTAFLFAVSKYIRCALALDDVAPDYDSDDEVDLNFVEWCNRVSCEET